MIKLSFRRNDYSFQDRDFKLCLKAGVQMHTQPCKYFYRPQTKFAKVMFLQVSVILSTGGVHAWLLWGGMRGCLGACVVAHGGACMVARGACVVALGGGMRGCSGGVHGCSRGACMVAPWGACVVAPGGGAWLLRGGGGMRGFFDEIRSMSGRYASYWNAFLFLIFLNSCIG